MRHQPVHLGGSLVAIPVSSQEPVPGEQMHQLPETRQPARTPAATPARAPAALCPTAPPCPTPRAAPSPQPPSRAPRRAAAVTTPHRPCFPSARHAQARPLRRPAYFSIPHQLISAPIASGARTCLDRCAVPASSFALSPLSTRNPSPATTIGDPPWQGPGHDRGHPRHAAHPVAFSSEATTASWTSCPDFLHSDLDRVSNFCHVGGVPIGSEAVRWHDCLVTTRRVA